MYLIILTIVLLYFIYTKATKNSKAFEGLGIKYETPWFLFGTTGLNMFKRKPIIESMNNLYNKYPKEKVFGLFDFINPVFVIRDVELIKKIAIKDFDNFLDRPKTIQADNDPILSNALTNLAGHKWRDMRSTLSPIFTGSKMKHMFELISNCSNQLSNYYVNESKTTNVHILDIKELFSRYTNDTIATCAFGIEVNSLENPKNYFFQMGKEVMDFAKFTIIIKILILRFLPKIATIFNLKFVRDEVANFFRSIILDTISVRTKENIVRPDLINLLMQVRKGNLKQENETSQITDSYATADDNLPIKLSTTIKGDWSDDELVAQCILFFLAGFDTTSTMLSFAANELALNEDAQEKLHREIIETEAKLNGKPIDYETLLSMKYLDMVVSEVLRKWPPAVLTNRMCIRDYLLDDGELLRINLKSGSEVWFPISGLHMDSKYFKNPEKFDPERFSDDNKDNIVPGSFIPFGVGPRNCIASRFALMTSKTVLYHMIKEFKFELCEKTVQPLTMGLMTAVPDKGIHLGLRKRS